MRRLCAGAGLALILTLPALAMAADAGQLNVTVGGGINVPSADEADSGYIVGGGLGYHLTPRLVVGGEVSYMGYGTERGNPTTSPYTVSRHFVDAMVAGKYFLGGSGRFAPYGKAFVGRYDFTMDAVAEGESAAYTYADLQYGGGVGLLVCGDEDTNLYFELLARQLEVEAGNARIYTFTMGMDVSFLP